MDLSKRIFYVPELSNIAHTVFEGFSNPSLQGGVIYSDKTSKFSIKFCHFSDCTASKGGAILINRALLSIFSSCFRECQAPGTATGGNVISYDKSTLHCEFVSTYKCAKSEKFVGENLFIGTSSQCILNSLNISYSLGHMGEASVGSMSPVGFSSIIYMNIANSTDHNLLDLGLGSCNKSNFIYNTPDYYLVSGFFGSFTLAQCSFYYNSKNGIEKALTFIGCKGDFSYSGISNTKFGTIQHTHIEYKMCNIHGSNCANTNKKFNPLIVVHFLYMLLGNKLF